MTHNPVKGVYQLKAESYEGRTPALGDSQARHLLKPPAFCGASHVDEWITRHVRNSRSFFNMRVLDKGLTA